MNSLFSAVSGQFSRYLIFGTMLPIILFQFLTAIFVFPLLPTGLPVLSRIGALDKEWLAVVVVAVTLVLTGLLYNVNIPLIRWYEGYPWLESSIGGWRKRQNRARRGKLSRLRAHLRTTGETLRKFADAGVLVSQIESERTTVAQTVAGEYPVDDLVLPTGLGNVIRNFEDYPRQQYGLDAIFLWSRIVWRRLQRSIYPLWTMPFKTSFDFFLNCSFVSAIEGTPSINLWACIQEAICVRLSSWHCGSASCLDDTAGRRFTPATSDRHQRVQHDKGRRIPVGPIEKAWLCPTSHHAGR